MAESKIENPNSKIASLGLFLALFSLAMLAWSGSFHSSDGLSMYAVSDSLVRYGRWDTETLRWMGSQQGNVGPDGRLYSRKGFATSVAALPLTWLGFHLPDVGPVHTTLLFTPLLFAATGLYLYHTVRLVLPRIGRGWALAVTLLWGVGSLALPYVKTFFSEPAVALTTVAALYHLLRFRASGSWRSALAMGAWLSVSFMTRSATAIVFPLFGLAMLAYAYRHRRAFSGAGRTLPWQQWLLHEWVLGRLFALAVPLLFGLALYGWYNWLRFGSPFDSGYIEGEDFSAIWWQGILGLTVSPGRGLLWYVPWLPLTLWGARRLWGRDRVLTALLVGCVVLYVLFYGKWYLWSGGYAWGPRFLVPIVPLLALLVAPLLDPGEERTPLSPLDGWPTLVWLLGGLGLLVNLVGVLWDVAPHQQALVATGLPLFDPVTFFDPQYAQIPGVLRLGLATPGSLDLAWVIEGWVERRVLALSIAIALAGVGAGSLAWRHRRGAALLLAGTMLVSVGLWLMLGDLRAFQGGGVQDALELLPDPLPPGSQLWYDDPEAAPHVLNLVKTSVAITGFNVDGPEVEPQQATRARDLASGATAPIFLISDGPDWSSNGLDALLLAQSFALDRFDAGRYGVRTYWQGPLSEPIAYDQRFSFPDRVALVLQQARVTPEVAPGHVLALELRWRVETPLPDDTQVFVHLYDATGERVRQADGPLAQGRVPASSWEAGDRIVDRHALRLADDLAPGDYTLHVGLYRLGSGDRAVASDEAGEVVLPVRVTAGE